MISRPFLIFIAFSLAEFGLILERDFIFKLLKLPEMRIPYMMSFSIFLFCALSIFSVRKRMSLLKTAITGIVVGQIVGTVSLTLANLFIPNGVQRNLASLKREGFFELLITDATIAFVLGGWLLGGSAFLLYGFLEKKFTTNSS